MPERELHVKVVRQPVPIPTELAIDWFGIDPDDLPAPEPSPAERAFAILEPHLSAVALYRP